MNHTYDNAQFYQKYSQMLRSQKGLEGAGEWQTLREMLPDFMGRRVLDLGCGFGWHCIYAAEHGAKEVLGLDISEKMLEEAVKKSAAFSNIMYRRSGIEDFDYPEASYDIVLSSLALHYVEDFREVCAKVRKTLVPGGSFVFSVEHPVFTAYGNQDWSYDASGKPDHWPVDRYFYEGRREAVFLGERVEKQHKTLTTYLNGLLEHGFEITGVREPEPPEEMLELPGMRDEMRRPMMLLVSAVRRAG